MRAVFDRGCEGWFSSRFLVFVFSVLIEVLLLSICWRLIVFWDSGKRGKFIDGYIGGLLGLVFVGALG